MFKTIDSRYGEGISKEQIKEFDTFINDLEETKKLNLCEDCHSEYSCGNDHDINLTDTGICSVCGKNKEVVCCSIANRVVQLDISAMSYHKNGQRIIKNAR